MKQMLIGKVRLPLCSKVIELLQHYWISPGQFVLNSWLIWTCFVLLCHRKRIQYHLEIFRQYCKLIAVVGRGRRVRGGSRDVGYFTFGARHGTHDTLITKLPDNVKGWKLVWFFMANLRNYPHN